MKNLFRLIGFLFLPVLLFTPCLNAQITEEWTKRNSSAGAYTDEALDIAVDAAGNSYVTGRVWNLLQGDNISTMKYSPSGSAMWITNYHGGYGDDVGNSIAVDAAGNVYVTGASEESSNFDCVTIKYNSSGVEQWVRKYNGPSNSNDHAYAITIDASGYIYITGSSYSAAPDVVTIKYNSAGTAQWVQRYNSAGGGFDVGLCLSVDASGNVYVGGYTIGNGPSNYLTIKYNSGGAEQWVKTYNGPGNDQDRINDIEIDAAGNVYVTGESFSAATALDITTIKYNSTGTLQWVQVFINTGFASDIGKALGVDASGNVYVTGMTGQNSGDGLVLKYNSSGSQQWVKYYNGPGNGFDQGNDLVLDASGNIYITGESAGIGTGADYYTIRYTSSGTVVWTQRYLGTGNGSDKSMAIALGPGNTVFITGSSTGPGSGYDYLTVKYSQTVGLQNTGSETPANYSLGQNYPNPFNPVTNIKIRIPDNEFVKLTVFDITGKETAVLVNEELIPGVYNVDFDASHLSSGTYFYRIEAGEYTDIKKMVLLK